MAGTTVPRGSYTGCRRLDTVYLMKFHGGSGAWISSCCMDFVGARCATFSSKAYCRSRSYLFLDTLGVNCLAWTDMGSDEGLVKWSLKVNSELEE
jgi:hypothetical protein